MGGSWGSFVDWEDGLGSSANSAAIVASADVAFDRSVHFARMEEGADRETSKEARKLFAAATHNCGDLESP